MKDQVLSERPAHVPAHLVVDFDAYNPPNVEGDFHMAWKALQDSGGPEIVWTVRNGGHWIPTRGRLVAAMFGDYENFSSKVLVVPKEVGEKFISYPASLDRPIHRPFRLLVSSVLGGKIVGKLEGEIRALVISKIEQFRLAGGCEFVKSYAEVLPTQTFMQLAGLPFEDVDMLKEINSHITHPDETMTASEANEAVIDYLREPIAKRFGVPGSDIFSQIVNGKIDGRPMTMDEALNTTVTLLTGSLDTVASLLSFIMLFLARFPAHRKELIESPELIPAAIEEFVRRFPVVSMGRMVARDMIYEGVEMKQGDAVIIPTPLHGLDERENDRPLEVDFHRTKREFSTFGRGPHRCPGAHIARLEIRLTLEEWLARIPEFEVATPDIHFSGGVVGVIDSLPLRWDVASTREHGRQ